MREVGRIDDHVGPLAQWSEQPPVGLDGLVDGAGLREGMAAPCLAEAAHEQIVGRIEEEHARVVAGDDAIDRGTGIAQAPVAAKVERDGHVNDARLLERRDDAVEYGGRKVFDAVKAQVFERFHRLTRARTGEPRNENDAQGTHMKLFSPERANALISKLEPLIEELLAKRRELAIKLLESDPALHHGRPAQRPRLAGMRSSLPAPRFAELKHEIGRLIYRIESFGCVVKDIDLGLVDFPSMRGDEPVYLCWKLGEPDVAYWHGMDEGFSARRVI